MTVIFVFLVFVILQSWFINGVHIAFKGYKDPLNKPHGNILYMLVAQHFEDYRDSELVKPLWGCVKCMASVWGTLSFWAAATFYGDVSAGHFFLWVFDIFILVYLNALFYKLA